MKDKPRSGLRSGQKTIPLQGVRIDARLRGMCSEVEVTQRYRNDESVPLECVYVFPLSSDAAVSGFTARIGKRVIEGQVRERDEAFATYDDAMADGHLALLFDQDRTDVFTASIGNLEPGESVDVTIKYVALLRTEGESIRFTMPTTVSPRYVPQGLSPEAREDDARVNPERRDSVPYGLTLAVDIHMDSNIRALESPSHPIRSELDGHSATVTLSSRDSALDRDFVLIIETKEAHKPSVRVASESDGTRVAMVTFMPSMDELPEQTGMEIDFVIDCSGSMQGDSIDEARRALALCVRAMAEEDTFNIIRFGSRYTSLWPEPRPYTQANLDVASQYIRDTYANMGGTEILSPLTQIYDVQADSQRPRQILLLTDGQVSNEDEVIALCRQNASTTRVFAFGIGAGASGNLVRGVARASRGAAEFIHPGERIETKVLRMFNRVSTPALTDVRMDWGGMTVTQTPNPVPPVFGGDSLTVFARVEGGDARRVTLTSKEKSWELAIDLERAEADALIPTLWARHAIQQLEDARSPRRRGSNQKRGHDGDKKRASIVELGVRYGLMSSATSYVAIEERSPEDRIGTQAEMRAIPIALTKGWGGRAAAGGARGARARRRPAAPPPRRAAPAPYGARPMGKPMGRPGGRPGAPPPMPPAPAPSAAFAPPPAARAPAAPSLDAMPMSSHASAATDSDRLFELLLGQRADGSFHMTSVLEIWLGKRIGAVRTAIDQHGEALVVTAVVVALLAREASERAAEWTAAVRKAKRWLGKQGQQFDGDSVL